MCQWQILYTDHWNDGYADIFEMAINQVSINTSKG